MGNKSPLAWVQGQAGMGKSGLIRTWMAAFNELGYDSGETSVSGYISGLELEKGSTDLEKWIRRQPQERHLLMIDGYDEAKHPDVALNFTQRAIDAGIRILVSSRSAVPDRLASIGTSLTLADLANSFGEDLLRNAGVEEHVLGKLLRRYGGSPLMLSMIVRALSAGTATADDLLNIDQEGAGLGRLLARTVGALSFDARRLLETLAAEQPLAPDDTSSTLESARAPESSRRAWRVPAAPSAEGQIRPHYFFHYVYQTGLEN